jgi:alanyl-tRNA synthetase
MIKKVATMVNGKGGGRCDFAQAGGERIAKIPEFKRRIAEWFNTPA